MLPTATKATSFVSVATFKQWIGVKAAQTKAISSLTAVGLVATAVCTAHGYQTNQFVQIAGATPAAYNGGCVITVVDANTFTYPLASDPGVSPATGTVSVTTDDGRYATMVDAASDELERQTGVPFVQRTIVERSDGTGKDGLILRKSPIASIASITVNGGTVDPSTYLVDAETGIVRLINGSLFAAGTLNVVVTYVVGFDVQDGSGLPSDALRAVLDLAKAIHDELVTNAIAATRVDVGPMSMIIKPAKFPGSVQRVIDAYARKWTA